MLNKTDKEVVEKDHSSLYIVLAVAVSDRLDLAVFCEREYQKGNHAFIHTQQVKIRKSEKKKKRERKWDPKKTEKQARERKESPHQSVMTGVGL